MVDAFCCSFGDAATRHR